LREEIERSLANPLLQSKDRQILQDVLRQCDLLDSRWTYLSQLCEEMPQTLVHGDLAPKNTRIKTSPAGDGLVLLDWETAGWGVPAIDLAQFTPWSLSPDLAAYRSVVRPEFADAQTVSRMSQVGRIFRLIAAMSWEKECLNGPWPARAMRHMELYHAAFTELIATVCREEQ
jgi:aminoglycoside phosphotransferase (APT) family kinase protein